MSYFLLLFCGILTALPLVFDWLFLLPWISLVPLFLVVTDKKSAYRHGLVFSLGYYAVVYHWFCYLYPMDFAGFDDTGSLLVILVAWFGMSVMQGLGTAFVPLLYRHLTAKRHELFAPFAAASLWCIMEWLQTQFWFGVPWARLAVTQYTRLSLIQSASLFGSLGLSFLMVLVNGFFVLAVTRYRRQLSLRTPTLIALLLFLLNFAYGALSISVPSQKDNTFVVAAIQGNIASGDKWADDSVSTSLEIYSNLTREAVTKSGAKLIVWPETVITTSLSRNATVSNTLSTLAIETEAYIAVGAYYNESVGDQILDYNSIYLYHPDGSVNENVYSKRHLVPFGEYLPMPEVIQAVLPFLSEMNLFDSELAAGTSPMLYETELGTFGALVCFDSIYETLALDSVREGAQMILLGTNDSWYKNSAAVYQHNGHAVLRAVENGRYVVRAANTGVSTVISDKGEVLTALDPLITGYVTAEASTTSYSTPYTVIGNLIVWLSFAYVGTLCAFSLYDYKNKKKRVDIPASL